MGTTFLKDSVYFTDTNVVHHPGNIYKCGSPGLTSNPLFGVWGPLSRDSSPLSWANTNDGLMGWAHYLGIIKVASGCHIREK
jgi:hypothetical protein